jgi:hypothetical protein
MCWLCQPFYLCNDCERRLALGYSGRSLAGLGEHVSRGRPQWSALSPHLHLSDGCYVMRCCFRVAYIRKRHSLAPAAAREC